MAVSFFSEKSRHCKERPGAVQPPLKTSYGIYQISVTLSNGWNSMPSLELLSGHIFSGEAIGQG